MEISISHRKWGAMADDPDSIPATVLLLIASLSLSTSILDFVRFGAVCRSWRFAALNHTHSPWIMLNNNCPGSSHRFHSAASGEQFPVDFPEAKRRLCWGPPFGWIFVHGANMLLNPITKSSISLPSLISFLYSQYTGPINLVSEFYFMARAILTANPDSPDCVLFVIHSMNDERVVYIRPGDGNWTAMEGEGWSDIVYFRGKLYGCLNNGNVLLISGSEEDSSTLAATDFAEGPDPEGFISGLEEDSSALAAATDFAEPPNPEGFISGPEEDSSALVATDFVEEPQEAAYPEGFISGYDVADDYPEWEPDNFSEPEAVRFKYLVDLGGELCMVIRHARLKNPAQVHFMTSYLTLGLEIYKLDICTKNWERLLSLGDKCIFLGPNYSYSAPASSHNLRSNCIYLSDEDYGFQKQIGGFEIENGQATPFTTFSLGRNEELYPSLIPPIWFTPTLR